MNTNNNNPGTGEHLTTDMLTSKSRTNFVFSGTPLTNYLNRNTQYANHREVMDFEKYYTDKCFEDIVDARIQKIRNENFNLTLLWSGGLDSTMLFYKFLNSRIHFKVIMTEMSEVENYNLFHMIKDKKFNSDSYRLSYKILDSIELVNYISDSVDETFISGDLGDQVFYSNLTYKYFYNDRHMPYRIIVPEEIIKFTESRVNKILKNNVNASIANWCWAIDFIYKWELLDKVLINATGNNRIITFFKDFEFEKWSVTNQVANSKFNKFTDKQEIRSIIRKYSNDMEWLDYKTKIGSQRMFFNPENYKDEYNLGLGI